MFGALGVERCRLDKSERTLYQAHFCGVCHAMAEYGGPFSSLLTNFDVTFWALVLSGLDPESTQTQRRPCTALPLRRLPVLSLSPQSRRALAALNTALVGSKLEDDHRDGEGWVRSLAFRLLGGAHRRAQEVLREQGFPVETLAGLAERQAAVEAEPGATLEALAVPTCQMLEAVFAHQAVLLARPELAPALQRVGSSLGRFLYVWDALQDQEQDRRRGRFNALEASGESPLEARRRMHAELAELALALSELDLGDRTGVLEGLLDSLYDRLLGLSKPPKGATGRQRLARAGVVRVQDECGDCGNCCDGCGNCGEGCGNCGEGCGNCAECGRCGEGAECGAMCDGMECCCDCSDCCDRMGCDWFDCSGCRCCGTKKPKPGDPPKKRRFSLRRMPEAPPEPEPGSAEPQETDQEDPFRPRPGPGKPPP